MEQVSEAIIKPIQPNRGIVEFGFHGLKTKILKKALDHRDDVRVRIRVSIRT